MAPGDYKGASRLGASKYAPANSDSSIENIAPAGYNGAATYSSSHLNTGWSSTQPCVSDYNGVTGKGAAGPGASKFAPAPPKADPPAPLVVVSDYNGANRFGTYKYASPSPKTYSPPATPAGSVYIGAPFLATSQHADPKEKARFAKIEDYEKMAQSIKELTTTNEELSSDKVMLLKAVAELENKVLSVKKSAEETQRAAEQSKMDAKEVGALEAQVTKLRAAALGHLRVISMLNSKNKELQDRFNEQAANISEYLKDTQAKTKTTEALTKANQQLELKLVTFNSIVKENEALRMIKTKIEVELEKVQTALQTCQDAIKENETMKKEIEKMNKENQDLKKKTEDMKKDNKDLLAEIAEYKAAAAQAATVAELQAQVQASKAAAKEPSPSQDISGIVGDLRHAEEQIVGLKAEVDQWKELANNAYATYNELLPRCKDAEKLRKENEELKNFKAEEIQMKAEKEELDKKSETKDESTDGGFNAAYWRKQYEALLAVMD